MIIISADLPSSPIYACIAQHAAACNKISEFSSSDIPTHNADFSIMLFGRCPGLRAFQFAAWPWQYEHAFLEEHALTDQLFGIEQCLCSGQVKIYLCFACLGCTLAEQKRIQCLCARFPIGRARILFYPGRLCVSLL